MVNENIGIDKIQQLCKDNAFRWTNHALLRLSQRSIKIDDVANALLKGEIIEEYPDDYPHPSCLVLGAGIDGVFLHVVCGIGKDELWLITAYYPDPTEWTNDFKARKEN